jgi:two-component system, OmpR family, response regulator
MRILVVEDDEFLQSALKLGLQKAGYAVDTVWSGTEATIALREINYDLLILDLGLPDQDGSEVLFTLRRAGQLLPVIIITARDSVEDKIDGLDLGANDYITKPFDMRELYARIRAVLRKSAWIGKPEITHGPIRFLPTTREVFLNDKRSDLTPREVEVLEILLQKAGHWLEKNTLIEQFSNCNEEPSENAIEIVIHKMRKKLEPHGARIRTLRGRGYMLDDD